MRQDLREMRREFGLSDRRETRMPLPARVEHAADQAMRSVRVKMAEVR